MSILTSVPAAASLVDTVAAHDAFRTFGKAVERAGLTDTLRGFGPFTLFVPTDAAFSRLPAGQLDQLFRPENKEALAALVNYHVIKGRTFVSDMRYMQNARTLNGKSAPISLTDQIVMIDGAKLTWPDISASNGVIHGIDKVNLPTAA